MEPVEAFSQKCKKKYKKLFHFTSHRIETKGLPPAPALLGNDTCNGRASKFPGFWKTPMNPDFLGYDPDLKFLFSPLAKSTKLKVPPSIKLHEQKVFAIFRRKSNQKQF